jgi:DNA-binding beta-propeller fold protein YncE/cytochrome c peroxidase
MHRWTAVLLWVLATAGRAFGGSSAPIALGLDGGTVWVANPDSDTVARIDASSGTRLGESTVGRRPRTLAVTRFGVFVTDQADDTITQIGVDGTVLATAPLAFGCAPYGIAANGAGDELYVSCQGRGELLVLGTDLATRRTITLAWPEPRGVLAADGKVYVSHFITKEPNADGHVSEIDAGTGAVNRVFAIAPDFATCETKGSGQGVANLLDAMAIAPAGAPAHVVAQLWVGGTLHNALRKGLFQRSRFFQNGDGIGLFPLLDFQSNPAGEGQFARRNIYKPEFHDIARAAIWKIDLASGESRGRLDVTNGGSIAGLAFAPDGTAAYAVDQMANGFYVFSTARGAAGNAQTLFGSVSTHGPGGADPGTACTGDPDATSPEDPFVLAPQARLVPTGGMNPLDATTLLPVDTGLEYTRATGTMRGVPDGVGTTPAGLALSADGSVAFVANYLARNVAVVHATPGGFRCQANPAAVCSTRLDCPGGECMPLVAHVVPSTATDPVLPEILDGKILFSTAARDAAGVNGPIPPWNELFTDGSTLQGDVTSTGRDGGSLACNSCHPDFGGQDGRTWDFSQFGSSLRNTMDLRGRASFAPGTCSHDPTVVCTTDAACHQAGGPTSRCRASAFFIPPNIATAEQQNFFNPMGTTHWNGDRDEVEDFEFTFRELLGASDCDGQEHTPEKCVGALIVRRFVADPSDVRVDLSPQPNRHRSERLDHLGDFVYSLVEFPRNPNLGGDGATPSAASERGRLLFNDPIVRCSFCHTSAPPSPQQFTDKKRDAAYDPTQTPRADLNPPFLLHDVGTTNVFDETNPFRIASDLDGLLGFTLFQNEQNQVPGNRNTLAAYITSVLNDVWNTAPYLHDGSAPTLLAVVRPCFERFGACRAAGKGRNIVGDPSHGVTSFLSARQLNDLVAFQKAPHGPIEERTAIHGVVLSVKKLRVKLGRRAGRDTLVLSASGSLGQQTFDATAAPLVASIGVPAGETMATVEWPLDPGMVKGRRGRFRFSDPSGTRANGLRRLALSAKGGKLKLQLVARTDLGLLRESTADLTIAVEVGADVAGVTQPFARKREGTVISGP